MKRKCFYCGKRKKTKRIKVNFWQDWEHYQREFSESRDYHFSYHDECVEKAKLEKSDSMFKKLMIGEIIITRISKDIVTERKKNETGPWCCFCDHPATKRISWPTHPHDWEFGCYSQSHAYHDECLEAELKLNYPEVRDSDFTPRHRLHGWALCIEAELGGESLFASRKPHIRAAAQNEREMEHKEFNMRESLGIKGF